MSTLASPSKGSRTPSSVAQKANAAGGSAMKERTEMGKVFRLLLRSREDKVVLGQVLHQDCVTSHASITQWLKSLDQQKKLNAVVDSVRVVRDKGALPFIDFAMKDEPLSEAVIITALLLPPLALLGLGYTYWYGSTYDGQSSDQVYFHPVTKELLADSLERACEKLYDLGQQHLDDGDFHLAEREFNLACLGCEDSNDRYRITLHAVRDRIACNASDDLLETATTVASEDGERSRGTSDASYYMHAADEEEIKANDEELLSELSERQSLSSWGMNSSHHSQHSQHSQHGNNSHHGYGF